MFKDSVIAIRRTAGVISGFEIQVGLYHGSVLAPFFFAMVMALLTE